MPDVKVFKSKPFVTKPFRAVFPHLDTPDKFGSFSIDCDVIENPDIEEEIVKQLADTLSAAHSSIGTEEMPTNAQVREGTYKEEKFKRIAFKMKETKTVKGQSVKQRPKLVDSHLNPLREIVGGGSLVQVEYFIQFTLIPTGCYLSVKLNAVKVLELVGPDGASTPGASFEATPDGFVSEGGEATPEPSAPSPPPTPSEGFKSGREF